MLSYKTVLLALLLSSPSLALPVRREVPQEHSHQQFLTSVQTSLQKNNPLGIVDSVFGLLGDAAATAGLGKFTDPDCLQQATADQAFTNAKADGDVQGMVDALIYRALERNTGKVGLASVACTSTQAVNPEIAAISQHQDPASSNAASVNKAIVLTLAQQIASVGGDPQDALKSGTFKPGNTDDSTGKGNTCDDANDATGCIFTQNLLVEDATAAEISAAVAGVSASSTAASSTATAADNTDDTDTASTCLATVTVTVSAADATATAAASTSTNVNIVTSTSSNIGNFGTCSVPEIIFAVGLDGRTESAFEPADLKSYNHGSADNINIITQFMCDQLVNSCKADATAQATCAAAKTATAAQTPTFGIAADTFNGFFGIATNFRNIEAVSDQGVVNADSTGGSVSVAATDGAAAATAAATAATAAATTAVAAASVTATASSIGNFGKCTVPEIIFAVGLDGRKESAFEPADLKSYNHGSADNINIITQFMCDQLVNSCGADATAKATCASAQTATAAQTPTFGIAADTFNSFFGIATNFRNVQAVSNQGQPVSGSTGGSVTVVPTSGSEDTAAATTAADVAVPSSTAASSASSGANLQTFTGNLGGSLPPPVTAGGKGFVTDNSDFVNLAAALGRSCDVQHNACANAANSSGNKSFTVSDCDNQDTQCKAAIS